MNKIVSVNQLGFTSDGKKILHDISFDVIEGEIFALLGHNGSGKSTLIDIILNDLKPTQGDLSNKPLRRSYHSRLGVVYDKTQAFPLLKIKELIHFYGVIYSKTPSKPEIERLLMEFELTDFWNSQQYKLSAGERRKLSIMMGILHDPDFLIMDEPFVHIDPLVAERIWRIVQRPGRTIFYTTHDWPFARTHSSRIGLLYKGRLLHLPTTSENYMAMLPGSSKMVAPYQREMEEILNGNEYYINDDKINLFANDFQPILKKMQKLTKNFSILDADISDVYLFLANKISHA